MKEIYTVEDQFVSRIADELNQSLREKSKHSSDAAGLYLYWGTCDGNTAQATKHEEAWDELGDTQQIPAYLLEKGEDESSSNNPNPRR